MENMISYMIIILLIVYMVYDEQNRGVIGIMFFMLLVIFYGYLWGQMYNVQVTQDYKNISYKNKMLWINTDMLDVTNRFDKEWANYVMMDCAPNKLGIYVERQFINKLFVLKQLETFKIMFGYNCPIIYFKHKPNMIIKNFLKKKGVEIINFSFRNTLN